MPGQRREMAEMDLRVIKVPVRTAAELSSSVTDLQRLLFIRPPHVDSCARRHMGPFHSSVLADQQA